MNTHSISRRRFAHLLGIGAATLGLIALNTSARFGPVRVSASVGKS